MTDEQFEKATNIKSDLELLRDLLRTQAASHWIGFVRAEKFTEIRNFRSVYMQERFESFIVAEINSLKKQFEEL